MNDSNTQLDIAIKFRDNEEYTEAENLLKKIIEDYPNEARGYYHYAWLCDKMEREKDAVPKYERAIELGLDGEELADCYLGLGSTYRTIGEYMKSEKILETAVDKFSERKELIVFLAMTKYNLKKYTDAVDLLLNIITNTTSDEGILNYKEAINYYSNKLDKIFD